MAVLLLSGILATAAPRAQGGDPGPPSREEVVGLLAELDAAIAAKDIEAVLCRVHPQRNSELHAERMRRLRSVFTSPVRMRRQSELLEYHTLEGRGIARVEHVLTAEIEGKPPMHYREQCFFVVDRHEGEVCVVLSTPFEETMLSHLRGQVFSCPACNFQFGTDTGWLAVPMRRDQSGCMQSVAYYSLRDDLTVRASIFVGEDSPEPRRILSDIAEAAGDRIAEAGPIRPWMPPAYGADTELTPPDGLAGAHRRLELADGTEIHQHIAVHGPARYLFVVSGPDASDRGGARHRDDLLRSFRFVDPSITPEMLQARIERIYTRGTMDGDRYTNDFYMVEARCPSGWQHRVQAGPFAFRLRFTSPDGAEMSVTGHSPPAGRASWGRKEADAMLARDLEAYRATVLDAGAWREPGPDGWQAERVLRLRLPAANPPGHGPVCTMWVLLDSDLLVTLRGIGHGVDSADEAFAAIRSSVRRTD